MKSFLVNIQFIQYSSQGYNSSPRTEEVQNVSAVHFPKLLCGTTALTVLTLCRVHDFQDNDTPRLRASH